MSQNFVQIRPKWNEMENSDRRTKRGSDFFAFILLMIEIYHIDGTWVMPQSFVQIRPNWNEMEYRAKKRQED